jgi:hypothetical protein
MHEEMLEMMQGVDSKLLNQLMIEVKTAMNQRSTKHLSIKFSSRKDYMALARRLQECFALIADLVW